MKKLTALFLALLMITSCMVFTTAAEEATTETTEEQIRFVPMSDCDSTASWSVSNQHIRDMVLTLDEQEFTQGTGSISFSFTGVQTIVGALNWQWQNTQAPLDITGMAALRFDFYANNAAAVINATYDIEIRDVDHLYPIDTNGDGKVDAEIEAGGQLRLIDYIVGDAKDGWNTVEIPFDKLSYWHNVDKTRVAYFRMFQTNPGGNALEVDGVATGEVQYAKPQNIVGFEGETTIKLDNVYFASVVQGGEPSGSYHWLTKGYNPVYFGGGTSEVSRGKVPVVDARIYDTVVFDVFVEDLSLGNANLCIELCSGGTCDYEESSVTKTLNDYAALKGQTLVPGWNTIEVPFSEFVNNKAFGVSDNKAKDGSCDYRTLDYFRLYFTKGSFTIDDDGDGVTGSNINTEAGETEPEREFNHYLITANVRLATRNTETATLIWDAAAAPVGGSANVTDIDGDGVKEWTWKNDAGKGEVTYGANTGALEIKFGTTASGYPNMVGLEMEIFVSDAAATNKGTFYMEISHANTCDGTPERSVSGTLNGIFGETIKAGEWQTVRVYHSIPDRLDENLLTYAKATSARDKTGTFNPAGFNYIRMYGGNFTATDLQIAMRNFKILRDFNYEQPTEENCTAPLTMDTTSPLKVGHTLRVPTEQDPRNTAWVLMNKKAGGTLAFAEAQSTLTFTEEQALDLSKMTTMHFDLYLQNYLPDIPFEFEMRSAGGDDGKERRFSNQNLSVITGNYDLHDGWNHVEIPLSAFSASTYTDMSAINYFRIFSQNSTITLTEDTIIAIDNLCFSGAGEGLVDEMNHCSYQGITSISSTIATVARDEDTNNKAWRIIYSDGTTATGAGARQARKTYVYRATPDSILSMDLYLENYEDFDDIRIYLELTSSGIFDEQETGKAGTVESIFGAYVVNEDGSKGTLSNGWNHIEIPYSKLDNPSNCDAGNISWICFYPGADCSVTGNRYMMAIDNLTFINPAPKTKIYSISPELRESIDFDIKVLDEGGYPLTVECLFAGDAGKTTTWMTAVPSDDGYHHIKFADIPAHRMTDTLSMKLWALDENGRLGLMHTVESYSVQTYAINQLKATQDAKLITLLSDLLAYGAAAQNYVVDPKTQTGYNIDNLATNVGEGITLTPTTTFTAPSALETVVSGTPADDDFDATFKVATLVLDGTVKIRFGFAANTADGLTVKVNDTVYTEFTTGTDSRGNELYYVDVPVFAHQFDQVFVATFGDRADYSVNYSVNHYIAKMYNPDQIKTAALLEALYNYGASAVNYIAR